jgi:hypothetical protein
MEQAKVDEAMEKLLLQPKAVEVDGQRVENHSPSDLIEVDRYLASKKALRSGRCPLRFTRMASGGAIG